MAMPLRASIRAMSCGVETMTADRKSTRLNSSHDDISYAVFCLKKNQPIELQIQSVATSAHLATVVQGTALVTEPTGHSLHPIFFKESGGAITSPFNITPRPSL